MDLRRSPRRAWRVSMRSASPGVDLTPWSRFDSTELGFVWHQGFTSYKVVLCLSERRRTKRRVARVGTPPISTIIHRAVTQNRGLLRR